MVENIKDLDEYCQLNNMSIIINPDNTLKCFKRFDYAQPMLISEDWKIYRWNSITK